MNARIVAFLVFYIAAAAHTCLAQYNATGHLVRRQNAGCEAGKTYCEQFGCLATSACPEVCTNRKDRTSCNFSVEGHGCRWESEACVVDVQCKVNPDGSCPQFCVGCGEFQCVNLGLSCPLPCAVRMESGCNTAMLYNGVSCKWQGGKCSPWNALEDKPLAAGFVVATQDFVTGSAASRTQESTQENLLESSLESSQEPTVESSTDELSTEAEDSLDASSELDSASEEEDSASSTAQFEGVNSTVASRSSGLGAGPIVGIAIGSLAIIGLVSWIVLYKVTKNRRGAADSYLDIDKHNPGQDPYGSKVDLITTAAELAHMGRR
ncbi:hypothetical protein DL89DRAFT_289737 [Linderina pennispora]|uniref:Mid2 domain-containing protein n=1 Tax=Linderina pennispora TaxID=61395 RepID=A0A1Y1WLP4_9FUNG|nr:uncharacterized protein DL89DRAFT_289737 [Linderina pennispora]ORX74106.1 hypothetical protein DL89DRAFT_289737 [Linderina pennispora]